MKYVGYYRVSTQEQGSKGLGIRAQKSSVRTYVEQNGEMVGEFQDVESGGSESRLGMEAAIEACRVNKATLVVKELSRITRGGFKYRQLLEKYKIDFIECDSAADPEFLKDLKFSMAKEERMRIKKRTKDALAQIKVRFEMGEVHISKSGNIITSLGKPENLTNKSREKSLAVRKAKADNNENNKKATAFILALHETHTLKMMAQKLNEAGFLTSRGCKFSDMQVKRLLDKAKKQV